MLTVMDMSTGIIIKDPDTGVSIGSDTVESDASQARWMPPTPALGLQEICDTPRHRPGMKAEAFLATMGRYPQ